MSLFKSVAIVLVLLGVPSALAYAIEKLDESYFPAAIGTHLATIFSLFIIPIYLSIATYILLKDQETYVFRYLIFILSIIALHVSITIMHDDIIHIIFTIDHVSKIIYLFFISVAIIVYFSAYKLLGIILNAGSSQ